MSTASSYVNLLQALPPASCAMADVLLSKIISPRKHTHTHTIKLEDQRYIWSEGSNKRNQSMKECSIWTFFNFDAGFYTLSTPLQILQLTIIVDLEMLLVHEQHTKMQLEMEKRRKTWEFWYFQQAGRQAGRMPSGAFFVCVLFQFVCILYHPNLVCRNKK